MNGEYELLEGKFGQCKLKPFEGGKNGEHSDFENPEQLTVNLTDEAVPNREGAFFVDLPDCAESGWMNPDYEE